MTNHEGYFHREEDVASEGDWNDASQFTSEHQAFPPTVIVTPPQLVDTEDIDDEESGGYYLRSTRRRLSSRVILSDSSISPTNALISSPTSLRSLHPHESFSGSLGDIDVGVHHSVSVIDDLNHLSPVDASNISSGFAASPTTERLTRIYQNALVWPLQEKEEAILMRNFVENLAPSLDLCDPDKHFALVVPHRAATSPILLNAIFACSAVHLSRVSDFDLYTSDRYYQECLKHLIPMLNDSAAVMDENLLAATVILRYLEEVQGI